MAKKEKLGINIINMSFAKCLVLVVSTISAMLLSRFRTLEEYGTYSQLLSIVGLFSSLFMLGLPNCINYFLAKAETEEEKKKFLNVYYSLTTLLSLFVGLILVCITPVIVSYFDNLMIKSFMYFLLIFPWTRIIIESIGNVLVVYGRTKLILIFNFSNSIALLSSILLIQVLKLNFQSYMICFILVEVFFSFLVYFIVKRLAHELRFCLDKGLIKKILKFSIPIGLAGMIGTIGIELDKLVIGRFFDTETYAIYANASKELPFTVFATAITAVVLPKIVICLKKGENKKVTNLWGNTALLSFIIMCLFVGGLIVFAPQVMTILYSEKYLKGVWVFRIYAAILLLRITYFGMILNSMGKTRFILYSSIASLILNLCLSVLFVILFGLVGPAIATAISIASIQILQLIISAKELKVSFLEIFPWKKIFIVLLINIPIWVLFFVIKKAISLDVTKKGIIIAVALGFIWAMIYGAIMIKSIKKLWQRINNYDVIVQEEK